MKWGQIEALQMALTAAAVTEAAVNDTDTARQSGIKSSKNVCTGRKHKQSHPAITG